MIAAPIKVSVDAISLSIALLCRILSLFVRPPRCLMRKVAVEHWSLGSSLHKVITLNGCDDHGSMVGKRR